MKRLIAVLLMLALVTAVPLEAYSAAAGTVIVYPKYYESAETIYDSVQQLKSIVDVNALRARIAKALAECRNDVDISDFDIPYSMGEAVTEYIYYAMPEAFNIRYAGYSGYPHEDVIAELIFGYKPFCNTSEKYKACLGELEAVADGLLKGIEGNTALTDVERALLLHDRLALITEYSFSSDDGNYVPHTAYGALVKGSAVCQGYAMAYIYLLERVGIEVYYCSSDKLNHGWNIVYIDGEPYHVDVTWDDLRWNDKSDNAFSGRVEHNNFLRSTQGIKQLGHTANDFNSSPTDTRYDNYFWRSSTTAFCLLGDEIYYIDGNSQTLNRFSDNKVLEDVSDSWYSPTGGIWSKNYACLSSAGGDLFYSLAGAVYKYDPNTDVSEKIYTPSLSGYETIFGFTYENGCLVLDINNTPNNDKKLRRVRVSYSDITPVLEGIEITSPPSKTVYLTGESFEASGMVITGIYTGNSKRTIDSGYTVSGFSSDSQGEKTVEVTYGGFTAQLTVTVKNPVSVITESDRVKAEEDMLILAEGVTVSEVFFGGSTDAEILAPDGAGLSDDDFLVTGSRIIFPDRVLMVAVAGDADCDGKVTSSDARLVLRASVGLEDFSGSPVISRAANVLSSDGLSSSDARAILRASVGLEKIVLQ